VQKYRSKDRRFSWISSGGLAKITLQMTSQRGIAKAVKFWEKC